jgi:uroporphyrin-III C-methyltransferase / precorrin-2 dehydrogenase / sirohydrochlorin ferrochelatase
MGMQTLDRIVVRLRDHGAPANLSAAVIERGTEDSQRVIVGTLVDLQARVAEAKIASPSLLIVGEVTRLHETLHWFNNTATQDHLAKDALRA